MFSFAPRQTKGARQMEIYEELKARGPLQWAGLMNSCKAQVEEIIYAQLDYA